MGPRSDQAVVSQQEDFIPDLQTFPVFLSRLRLTVSKGTLVLFQPSVGYCEDFLLKKRYRSSARAPTWGTVGHLTLQVEFFPHNPLTLLSREVTVEGRKSVPQNISWK